jgi:hypothetical protein
MLSGEEGIGVSLLHDAMNLCGDFAFFVTILGQLEQSDDAPCSPQVEKLR